MENNSIPEGLEAKIKIMSAEMKDMIDTIKAVRGNSYAGILTSMLNLQEAMRASATVMAHAGADIDAMRVVTQAMASAMTYTLESFGICLYPDEKDCHSIVAITTMKLRGNLFKDIMADIQGLSSKKSQFITDAGEIR